ncbi:MAG TPA: YezD family protein [Verrucomicrobiae bacterium]|nr:YezD family protein [Verrucomicrobiae bacterium]
MKAENLNNAGAHNEGTSEPWLGVVRDHVSSLEFGVVQIVVHGARVVQIERTEKIRFENPIAVSNRQD